MQQLLSTLEYLLSAFAGVVARVESLRGRMSEAGQASWRLPEGRVEVWMGCLNHCSP